MRVVLDTNVLVSGLISPRGTPAQLHAAWRRQEFALVTSPALVEELTKVLSYPHIVKRLHWTGAERPRFFEHFLATVAVVSPAEEFAVGRDPDDNRVLEAAQAGFADFIVTGDLDLLVLREFAGIPIVRPAVFLQLIGPA